MGGTRPHNLDETKTYYVSDLIKLAVEEFSKNGPKASAAKVLLAKASEIKLGTWYDVEIPDFYADEDRKEKIALWEFLELNKAEFSDKVNFYLLTTDKTPVKSCIVDTEDDLDQEDDPLDLLPENLDHYLNGQESRAVTQVTYSDKSEIENPHSLKKNSIENFQEVMKENSTQFNAIETKSYPSFSYTDDLSAATQTFRADETPFEKEKDILLGLTTSASFENKIKNHPKDALAGLLGLNQEVRPLSLPDLTDKCNQKLPSSRDKGNSNFESLTPVIKNQVSS